MSRLATEDEKGGKKRSRQKKRYVFSEVEKNHQRKIKTKIIIMLLGQNAYNLVSFLRGKNREDREVNYGEQKRPKILILRLRGKNYPWSS